MAVLSGLKPEKVFYYFEELCKIPHGSYNTKQISDYLVSFAKEHNLEYRQDASNNVVIKKPATPGYESAPVTILQGHCDMVCEKVPGSAHDFMKDGLELMINGDNIEAKDTTLGGDDGIAVAYALAILASDDLKHPALEVLITTDEEVGLLGAKELDCSDLKGTYFINIDSEEEGSLWISCAGGLSARTTIPVRYKEATGVKFEVVIDGLTGGHSGAEIDKIRANSNKLMGQLLFEMEEDFEIQVSELEGGQKDNAIPRTTRVVFTVEPEDKAQVAGIAARMEKEWNTEYAGTDNNITVSVKELGKETSRILDPVSLEKIIFFLVHVPYGIQKMSGLIEGLVETSINPGILKLGEKECTIVSSIRSSIGSAKEALRKKVEYLSEFLGGDCVAEGDYPAWEYREDSKLRDIMVDSYEELFGEKPVVKAIHAGLECGLFYEKIPNMDAVSFGPTMKDIHTSEEKLSISSTQRMWEFLTKTLENIHA